MSTPPNLPKVPNKPASPTPLTRPASPAAQAPAAPKVVKDPTWWRLGSVPFLVLVMVAAAADLAWPDAVQGIGLGAGIGCFLAINALLLLRKDFTKGEYWFLQGLAALSMLAISVNGSMVNWFICLVLPFFIVMTPSDTTYTEPGTKYRSWWSYWVARRQTSEEKKSRFAALRALLPLIICVLIGIIFFIGFLCIFASGNPVVEIVWNTLVDWWNRLVRFLHISWDYWVHVSMWFIGILWFGIYCFSRPTKYRAPEKATVPTTNSGTTIMPYLPLCILVGINAAFAVATSTDIAFLWFGNVPEGISQTTYLHEGAISITWAAVLAVCVLLILFRANGTARNSTAPRICGYLLVLQTFLLAISVYMRLYHQISDFGFTVRRIQAAEAMLMGLAGLVILVLYMAKTGTLRRYAGMCFGTLILLLIAFSVYKPARLAGNLNLIYLSSHPHWKFSSADFRPDCFVVEDNLAFAEYVYNKEKQEGAIDSSYRLNESLLHIAASNVAFRAGTSFWYSFTLATYEDIPAAERILGRPIRIHMVEGEK